jgi:hypothetical protein
VVPESVSRQRRVAVVREISVGRIRRFVPLASRTVRWDAARSAWPAHRGRGRALPATRAGACRPAVPAAVGKRARRWRMAGSRSRAHAGGTKRRRPCFGGKSKALVAKSVAGWGARRPRAEYGSWRLVARTGSTEGLNTNERKGPQTGANEPSGMVAGGTGPSERPALPRTIA